MDVDLFALIDPTRDSGVPGGTELLAFSDAVLGPDRAALDRARTALTRALGPAAVSGAAAVAANFTKNDRIANGCGIPVDPMVLKMTKDIREALGLNAFPSAANTFVHFPGA